MQEASGRPALCGDGQPWWGPGESSCCRHCKGVWMGTAMLGQAPLVGLWQHQLLQLWRGVFW